ncbi:sll1863 family stress response protein [Flavobacterium cellulosilyticum]|uniref:Peptidase M23 n=1 Tax=Flavobacterium cellulosilyticum TaxID=2541731 RepID=A0A4R5CJD5_9FLAO|nr:hypothetical protein [Flavobacterium cellulosilyticum]TDD98433.1 hypothetical protein E0F76_04665 [Flavobacterium cellulosilyticum]
MKKTRKMNKIFFSIGFLTFMVGLLLVGCKPETKEEKEANENVLEANDTLTLAKKNDNTKEWQAFKISTDSIINENEIRITELKTKMKNTGKSIDAKYEKNIDLLEQKNSDLKVKIEKYKKQTNSDWQSFKREFNHDINEIGKALKDLTIDNKK